MKAIVTVIGKDRVGITASPGSIWPPKYRFSMTARAWASTAT